jgi:hypothetical protein
MIAYWIGGVTVFLLFIYLLVALLAVKFGDRQ